MANAALAGTCIGGDCADGNEANGNCIDDKRHLAPTHPHLANLTTYPFFWRAWLASPSGELENFYGEMDHQTPPFLGIHPPPSTH